jgi:hypothetical protein
MKLLWLLFFKLSALYLLSLLKMSIASDHSLEILKIHLSQLWIECNAELINQQEPTDRNEGKGFELVCACDEFCALLPPPPLIDSSLLELETLSQERDLSRDSWGSPQEQEIARNKT